MRRWLFSGLIVAACTGEGEGEPSTDTGSGGSSNGSDITSDDVTEGESAPDTTAGSTTSGSSGPLPTTTGAPVEPVVLFPRTSIADEELAVVVDDDDPLSVQVAEYYVRARGLPEANVVHIALPDIDVLTPEEFGPIRDDVEAQLPASVQALALTFTTPYRVGCMSITSAFTFGHDPSYCGDCNPTTSSPYYDSPSLRPWDDHGMRPTMMLAAESFEDAQALIDRGVASDGTHPMGTGYYVRTTDAARSVRWRQMEAMTGGWGDWDGLLLEYTDNSGGRGSNLIEDADDVVFYFTGLANVGGIGSNAYRPGAMADHLTSFGGQVPTSGQMSALRWLEAGATASYGTVIEPCNYPEKFPHVGVATSGYFRGQTAIESYWKSVAWPGEGLFIGEPLARPWDGSRYEMVGEDLVITTNLLVPGLRYDVEAGDSEDGPWEHVLTGSIPSTQTLEIVIEGASRPYYRVVAPPG